MLRPPATLPHLMIMITRAERGGAQSHVLELLQLRNRARITLVSGEDGFLMEEARALNVETVILPALGSRIDIRQDLLALTRVTGLLRTSRPDLLHLHSSKAGLIGRIAAKLTGVPTVFTAHGWAFTEGASSVRRQLTVWSERLCAPLSDAIITVSEYDRMLAIRMKVTARAQTIHNALQNHPGSGHPPLARHQPPSGETIRLLMVARFVPQKDQALLLRAAAELPETEVWMIGDGPGLPDAQNLARTLGIQDRVRFMGNCEHVGQLLTEVDVFCLCSHYEGLPISILEAMRAGLPVVASNVGGIPEAVIHGRTGLVVPHADVNSWKQALRLLIDHPELRREYGEAGQALFERAFTTPIMLRQTWSVYRNVWKSRDRPLA